MIGQPPLGPGGWGPPDVYASNVHAVPSAYGPQAPWWPQQNLEHHPTVQPQPNPYYPHWPRAQGGITSSVPRPSVVNASYSGVGLVSALGLLLGAATTRTATGAVASAVTFGAIGFIALLSTGFSVDIVDPDTGRQ